MTFSTNPWRNAAVQLRRAISIRAEGIKLLEKHAIGPSAARLVGCRVETLGASHNRRPFEVAVDIKELGVNRMLHRVMARHRFGVDEPAKVSVKRQCLRGRASLHDLRSIESK